MSRVVELQDGLVRDPAYAFEFAKLEEDLAKLKTMVRTPRGKLEPATERRKRTDGVEAKARIA